MLLISRRQRQQGARLNLRTAIVPAIALASALVIAPSASGQVIYKDDFSGTGNLNDAAPDVRPGTETWDATDWQADGTITAPSPGPGMGNNAFLPFSPLAGKVYSLSLDVNPTAATDPTTWFALGFTSTSSPANDYFALYSAAPWMLLHVPRDGFDNIPDNTNDLGDIETFDGPIVAGFQDHDAPHGVVNFQIILDTTSTLWQTSWLVNNTLIRSDTYAANPSINDVGFGRLQDATGYVDNFELSVIPEPASVVVFAAVLAPIAIRRSRGRQRRHSLFP